MFSGSNSNHTEDTPTGHSSWFNIKDYFTSAKQPEVAHDDEDD
jgi:hypothetical protein